jgi:hypothetical protein
MTFFPLKFRATVQRRSATEDDWGQNTYTYSTLETPKCLFLATSGNKNSVAREQFSTAVAFYVEPTSQIEEGDRVVDIKDALGNIVEPGPFEVVSAKRTGNHLTGKLHHISCKLIGAA